MAVMARHPSSDASVDSQIPRSPSRAGSTIKLATNSTRLRLREMVNAGTGRSTAVK